MKSLYLDETTKDLTLTSTKNLRFTSNDGEYVAQKIESVLTFFKGEYFLNVNLGIPYFEDIFKKNPDLILINSIFRNAISNVDGVEEVLKFEMTYNTQLRLFNLDIEVRVTQGDIINIQSII